MTKITIKRNFNNGKYEVFEGRKKIGTFLLLSQAEDYKAKRSKPLLTLAALQRYMKEWMNLSRFTNVIVIEDAIYIDATTIQAKKESYKVFRTPASDGDYTIYIQSADSSGCYWTAEDNISADSDCLKGANR